MSSDRNTDWQEPLYDYAVRQMKLETLSAFTEARDTFLFLGKYRDSADLCGICAEKLRLLKDAPPADRRRAQRLLPRSGRSAQGRPGTAGTFQKRLGAVICALALLAAVFLAWQTYVLHTARVYEEQEAYADSLKNYWKLLVGPYCLKAAAEISRLRVLYADSTLAEQEYQQAVDLYTDLGDKDAVKNAYDAWGTDLAEKGMYGEAVAQFTRAEDEEKIQETYLIWSDAEAADGRTQEAIDVLLRAESSDAVTERLSDLRHVRCEDAVRALRSASGAAGTASGTDGTALGADGTASGADGMASGADGMALGADDAAGRTQTGSSAPRTAQENEQAAAIGAALDDVDSLLKYCRVLAECGYEPGEVFPDGVEVIDVPTGNYQPPEEEKAILAEQFRMLPLDGTGLFFTRDQLVPDDPDRYLAESSYQFSRPPVGALPWDPADDNLYRVKLQVAELYQLPEEKRAESLQTCSWYYLADTIYRTCGTAVMLHEYRIYLNGHWTTQRTLRYYPFLAAADSGVFYVCADPALRRVIGYQISRPEAQTRYGTPTELQLSLPVSVPGDPTDLTKEELADIVFGEPDPVFRKWMLKKGVDTVIGG